MIAYFHFGCNSLISL